VSNPAQPIDRDEPFDRLCAYLRDCVFPAARDIRILNVDRPRGGQSWEIFLLKISVQGPEGEVVRRIVLKRAPAAVGPLGPYDVEKEGVILEALAGTIPVPPLLAYNNESSAFTAPFTVTEFVEGESVDLYRVERWETWQRHRRQLGTEILTVLAKIQQFDWRTSNVASVLAGNGGSAERVRALVDWYLRPYAQLTGSLTAAQLFWKEIGLWLKEHVEDLPEEELVLLHGDLRFGNVIWSGTRIVAVLDWERAALGDPMSDLGFFSVPMARRHRPELMGMALTVDDLFAEYHRTAGVPVDRRRFQFYVVLWQFVEGSLASRPGRSTTGTQSERKGGIEIQALRSNVGKLPLGPNLHIRQILPVVEAYEAGHHDVV
jgi:aminoglycoside phosphotransferase (APT) family kinase protein